MSIKQILQDNNINQRFFFRILSTQYLVGLNYTTWYDWYNGRRYPHSQSAYYVAQAMVDLFKMKFTEAIMVILYPEERTAEFGKILAKNCG